jgi:thiol-disulfide isomerase/thioredoxin
MDFLKNINMTYVIVGILIVILVSFFCGNLLMGEDSQSSSAESFNSIETLDSSDDTIKSNGDKGEIKLFYASWCGWSQKILPEWEKFEQDAKVQLPGLRVTRVICEGDNEAQCMQQEVEGYPTVIFYPKDGAKIIFEDDRSAEKLLQFAKQNTN